MEKPCSLGAACDGMDLHDDIRSTMNRWSSPRTRHRGPPEASFVAAPESPAQERSVADHDCNAGRIHAALFSDELGRAG
jgi:hypothetical protein